MLKTDSNALYWSISALLIVVVTVLSLLNEGSLVYMCSDDYGPLAAMCKKDNPELYPKDEFIRSLSRSYITYYYNALYQASRLADIKTACLVFHILTRLLFFTSIFLLSISLFSKHEIGWLSMLMFVLPKSLYGSTPTISYNLHPQYLAVPLLLIGLACLFRKQIIVFAIILSAILYIHAMTAIWGLLIGSFCWLGIKGYKHIRQSGLALILGAIIALPFLYQYFQSGAHGGELILARQQMESLARWRIAPHVFPLSWGLTNNIIKLSAICGIVVLGYLGVRKRLDLLRVLAWVTVGTFLIWSAGLIFTEVHYLPVMNKMQLFRSSSIELILLSVFLANVIWVGGYEYLTGKNYLAIFILAGGVLCFSITDVGSRQILGIVIMIMSVVISHEKTNLMIEKMAIGLMRWYRNYGLVRKLLVPAVLVIMGGVAVYAMGNKMIAYCENTGTISGPLKEAALWAQANTPLDALFVTPPVIQGFRYWSQRSQLPDWKDGGLGNYDANYGAYFLEVMKSYGFRPGMNVSYLARISAEQIISVGRQFDADYAVLPETERALSEKTVFKNDCWRIVRLK